MIRKIENIYSKYRFGEKDMIEYEKYPHMMNHILQEAVEFSKITKIPVHELLGVSEENLRQMNVWLENHFKNIDQKILIPNLEIEENPPYIPLQVSRLVFKEDGSVGVERVTSLEDLEK